VWGEGEEDVFYTAGFFGEEHKDCGCLSRTTINTAECCDVKTDVKIN
jgi:hypothetical protein